MTLPTALDLYLTAMGVLPKPQKPAPALPPRDYPPVWKPAYPGEEPPF